jgi:hypothetical protein
VVAEVFATAQNQVQEPAGRPWTTVNTAVRYVLEKCGKATDQVIRKSADRTLSTPVEIVGDSLPAVMRLSRVDYEWLSSEQQEPAERFGCPYFWAGSAK